MHDYKSSDFFSLSSNRSSRFTPLVVAVSVVLGILIGSFYANHFSGRRINIINSQNNKLADLLQIIDDQYVDTVDFVALADSSLIKILAGLDPHSVYIPAKEVADQMQELNGSFSGIGVQFAIYEDTINIIRVLENGPSEAVGILPGDKIIAIDGDNFIGKEITNDSAMHRLKGADQSSVRLTLKRGGHTKPIEVNIVRGAVPVRTVDAYYMIDPKTGYIRITAFGQNTYSEFLAAMAALGAQGNMQNLVVDLRGNAGGYAEVAAQIVNEFLPSQRVIYSMKGRKFSEETNWSDGRGSYQNLALVVLIDELSASASEIVAGAVQDNDRGSIIGRRSFGKGLVQKPFNFNDGSMLRLTVARYYTASGRCVQKPYELGHEDTYRQDLSERISRGEVFSADSIKKTGQLYYTKIGRPVYGGGGITPDYFIAIDTSHVSSYYAELYERGMVSHFAYLMANNLRKKYRSQSPQKLEAYLLKNDVANQLADFAEHKGIKRRNLMLRASYNRLQEGIISNVLMNIYGVSPAVAFLNRSDKAIVRAKELFAQDKATPQVPEVAMTKANN
ncbi:MAG: S41 family peptidase [Bacteroidales bacterium]|nr:S41 family peptidase [Bacteroidales bacterium]